MGSKKSQTIGSVFHISCNIEEGSHPIFFEWFKNAIPLKSSPEVNYKIENSRLFSTLTIESIEMSDSANYSCFAKNSFGSDSHNIVLNINGMFAFNSL